MKNLSLIQRLLLAIVLGAIFGQLTFLPDAIFQFLMTVSGLFYSILNFILPLMVIGFIVSGITRLTVNAGKLLGFTLGLEYLSLIFAGLLAFVAGQTIFPLFINQVDTTLFDQASGIEPWFEFPIEPFFSVAEATVFSFIVGISLSFLQSKSKGATMVNFFDDFQQVISATLSGFIIPCLPFYVFCNFMNLSYSGNVLEIIKLFLPVYLLIFVIHFVYLLIMYLFGSKMAKISFTGMLKNSLPAYLMAFGTQSSAASIPVSVQSAKNNGLDEEVAEFALPLGASTHLPGSMITISSLVLAVNMISGGDTSVLAMLPFYLMTALALVAAPGVPGGGVMTALPYLGLVGLPMEGAIPSLLITLYLTQDSFGTSINVTSDQAIACFAQKYYDKTEKGQTGGTLKEEA